MIYQSLLAFLAAFTSLDAVITVVGINIGCIELNPVVGFLGVGFWIMFRMLLLGCMLTVFFAGYRFCLKYFVKGARLLRMTLFGLDVYIGAVVFHGILAIFSKLI